MIVYAFPPLLGALSTDDLLTLASASETFPHFSYHLATKKDKDF